MTQSHADSLCLLLLALSWNLSSFLQILYAYLSHFFKSILLVVFCFVALSLQILQKLLVAFLRQFLVGIKAGSLFQFGWGHNLILLRLSLLRISLPSTWNRFVPLFPATKMIGCAKRSFLLLANSAVLLVCLIYWVITIRHTPRLPACWSIASDWRRSTRACVTGVQIDHLNLFYSRFDTNAHFTG